MKSTRKSWLGWLAVTLLASPAVYAQAPEFDAYSGSVRINGGDPYADYRADAGYAPTPPGYSNAQTIYQNYGPDQVFGGGYLPPDGVKVDPAFRAAAGLGGPSLSELDRIRLNLYKVSGEVAGQGTGFTNIGAFVPMRAFSDYNLFAVNPRVLIDDTGNAGFNFGVIHRFYVPEQDRMYGHSVWWDFSRSYHDDMHQFGWAFETVGRYVSYRLNANWVAGNRQRVFHQQFFDPVIGGNNIVVPVLQNFEAGVSNYSMEVAMPAPFLGKYGLELGVGPYLLTASGVSDAVGVAARAQWQLTEDAWVNTVVTNDKMFDTNVSVNFELRLPGGMPSRILRPNPVVMSLTQQVQRNYQVKVARAQRMKYTPEINPQTGTAFLIAIIDPNTGVPGNGSAGLPYMSLDDYMSAPLAVRQGYDIVFVRRRNDNSDVNLNTTLTLEFAQRLLGDGHLPDGIPHLYTSTRGTFVLPGQTPGPLPLLTNNAPGVAPGTPIVRLNDFNEVSGFRFNGSGTGGAGQTSPGILGVGTRGFNINRNFFHNTTDAVRITADTTALGTPNVGVLDLNTVTQSSDDGFEIRAIGAADPLQLHVTRNTVRNSGDDGMNLVVVGSTLTGRITDNRFDANAGNGVQLDVAASGVVSMGNANTGFNIDGNSFSGNGANGFQVNALDGTDNRIGLWFTGNVFGDPSAVASDNQGDGLQFNANSGEHTILIGDIGGVDADRANRFLSNRESGIAVNLSGSAIATTDIQGNTIVSGADGAATFGVNVTGSTFNNSGFAPPDTHGAVGVSHVVEMLNGVFAIYDKSTGNAVSRQTLDAFFDSVAGIARVGTTQRPRIIYDPTVNRWFATAIDGGNGNRVYIAVSNTGDPTGAWSGVQFVAAPAAQFNDFATLGISAEAVVITTTNVAATGPTVSVYSIPKADLLAAVPTLARLSRFDNLATGDQTPQAVVDFHGIPDGTVELLSTLIGGGNQLLRRDLLNAGGAGAGLTGANGFAVPGYVAAPAARQPGATPGLVTATPRIGSNIVKVGNSIWAVHTVAGTTGNSAVRWYEIDAASSTVLQTGLIQDPQVDYLDASIAVNQQGKVVIGFTGSGPNQNPSAMLATGLTTAGVTTFANPIIAQAGTDPYLRPVVGGNRWGDYSATVVDPTAPNSFWTFQEFSAGSNIWAVQITQVLLGTAGRNGININTSDTSRLVNSRISRNRIDGFLENGILVTANDASLIRNLPITDNTFDGNGNSIHLVRNDAANFRTTSILRNVSNSATANGLFIEAFGTSSPTMDVVMFDNQFLRSADSNLRVESHDDAVINLFGPRDRFDLGGAGLTAVLNDNSVQNLTFQNTTFDNNTTHGQLITVNNNATLNYSYTSPPDAAATFRSSTSGNGSYGFLLRAFDNAAYNVAIGDPATLANVVFSNNTDVGIGIDAAGDSVGTFNLTNTAVSGTLNGVDTYFNGDGLAIRLQQNARLNRLQIGQTTASNTTFNGNAGAGIRWDLNQTARIVDPLIDRVTANGNAGDGLNIVLNGDASLPNARVWRSAFNANAGDGIHIERNSAGVIDNFRIGGRDVFGNSLGNVISGNADDGVEIIARNADNIDDYTIADNTITGNGTSATAAGRRGIHLRAEGDAQIDADILFNLINSNASHGIQLTTVQNALIGDSRSVTGDWFGNQINSNGADGINIGGVHGFLGNLSRPLQIGALGTDLFGRSFGNEIRLNAESGIDIEPFSDFFFGPFGTSTANIVNNLIAENIISGIEVQPSVGTTPTSTVTLFGNTLNTNIFDNRIFDNGVHGITVEGVTTGSVNVSVRRNEIRRNARDGVQVLASSGNGSILTVDQSVFVDISDNNFITDNGGRGVDVLVRGTANAQVIVDEAFIARNTEEGVYAVVTAALEQSNEVRSSVPLLQNGVITNDAFLDLTVANSFIINNNTAGGAAGGGLVLRVGTTGASPFANAWDDPDTTDPSAKGGLLARIDNNFINNNFGVDFLMHTFTSTVDPNTTGGTWSDNNNNPRTDGPNPPGDNTFNPTGYQQDALARVTILSFTGNSGTSADVFGLSLAGGFNNQNFAFYDNAEAVFKSRTQNQDGNDPAAGFIPGLGAIDDNGPFSNASAGVRIRNATRLPYRDADNDGNPDVPPLLTIIHAGRNSDTFLFPGLGPSTLRIDAFSDLLLSGFTTVISDFTDVITFANSGAPAGILPPNSPFYAFDTF